jgi:hypothetical protein
MCAVRVGISPAVQDEIVMIFWIIIFCINFIHFEPRMSKSIVGLIFFLIFFLLFMIMIFNPILSLSVRPSVLPFQISNTVLV